MVFVFVFLLSILSIMSASILWDGSASRGKSAVWNVLNLDGTGTEINVVEDSEYGQVWSFHKPKGAHRCEGHGAKGFEAKEGDSIFIGWRYKFHTPTGAWVFQWKAFGDTHPMDQNYPIVMKTDSHQLGLMFTSPGKVRHDIWATDIAHDKWYSIVLHLLVSRDEHKGFIELWFDGKQQTLNKNSTRYAARTLDAGHCDPKWGVYGGDDGDHTTFVAEPKIGTTLEDVTPQ